MHTLVGIPTYSGAHRLRWLLKSILIRPPHPEQIVVVDDGSPVPSWTRDVVKEYESLLPIHYIEHGSNQGISQAWNTCTQAFRSNNVVLINDDVIVSSGWLESLVHVLDHSPDVGVVGQSWHSFIADDVGKLLESEHSDKAVAPRDPVSKVADPSRREKYEDTNPGRVMAPTGQLFAFRRQDFDAVGAFDVNYKSFYEESDFGTSMAAKLKKIGVQINWPFNWHMWSATFGSSPELRADDRLRNSRAHYRAKWQVPDGVHEFDYTNPKYLGAVGDVAVEFLRRDGSIGKGNLAPSGAFTAAL